MRETFHARLAADAAFTDIVPAERLYAEGGVPDTPGDFPFAVQRWGASVPELRGESGLFSQTYTLWVYDSGGDYLRIGTALRAARPVLAALDAAGARTDLGVIMGVHYLGTSQDLRDDSYRALARYSSWRVVGTGE